MNRLPAGKPLTVMPSRLTPETDRPEYNRSSRNIKGAYDP
jgi:hypothetical protein